MSEKKLLKKIKFPTYRPTKIYLGRVMPNKQFFKDGLSKFISLKCLLLSIVYFRPNSEGTRSYGVHVGAQLPACANLRTSWRYEQHIPVTVHLMSVCISTLQVCSATPYMPSCVNDCDLSAYLLVPLVTLHCYRVACQALSKLRILTIKELLFIVISHQFVVCKVEILCM